MVKDKVNGRLIRRNSAIKLLSPVQEGMINLKAFDYGRITDLMEHEQTAEIYFRLYDELRENVLKGLELNEETSLRALLMKIPFENLAVYYDEDYHKDIQIIKAKALLIPCVLETDLIPIVRSMKKRLGLREDVEVYYSLGALVKSIRKNFKEWINENISFEPIPEHRIYRLKGEVPLYTLKVKDEFKEALWKKKYEIEHQFAYMTKIYAEVTGNLHIHNGMIVVRNCE